jgi:hypothetical protein
MSSLEQQYRTTLHEVDDALGILVRNQNALLDAVDLYQARIGTRCSSERFVTRELIRTINIIASLPHQLAGQVYEWKLGMIPTISSTGFKQTVLDELLINFSIVDGFMKREKVPMPEFSLVAVQHAFTVIVKANALFGKFAGEPIP